MIVKYDRSILVLVAGAGGFLGGELVRWLLNMGARVTAVDKKELRYWYQLHDRAENVVADLQYPTACRLYTRGATEVYNLAADMGGMGFIENNRIECMRNVLINTNLIEAACEAGVDRYLFASSACVYNTELQKSHVIAPLKEADAYPAMAERGYGWEKLFSEMVCQEYWAERSLKTFIPRFHNAYGPHGTWRGGREKAPAAMCRKVIGAVYRGDKHIDIWGDGQQTRSFMYLDDCIAGILRIAHCDSLIATPVNLGSSESVTIDQLAATAEAIAGVRLEHRHVPGPLGVGGRNSDNTLIKQHLKWEPTIPLGIGMAETYDWIRGEYLTSVRGSHERPAGNI